MNAAETKAQVSSGPGTRNCTAAFLAIQLRSWLDRAGHIPKCRVGIAHQCLSSLIPDQPGKLKSENRVNGGVQCAGFPGAARGDGKSRQSEVAKSVARAESAKPGSKGCITWVLVIANSAVNPNAQQL